MHGVELTLRVSGGEHDGRWQLDGAALWVTLALSLTGWTMLLTAVAALVHRLRR